MIQQLERIYKCISSERYTPYSLARKIDASAILESASLKKGKDRFSILMTEEAFRIIQDEEGVSFIIDGKRMPFNQTESSVDAMGHEKKADILDALLYVSSQHSDFSCKAGIPIPTSGIGYLSYEFARHCDNIRFFEQEDELKVPESLFIAGHIYIIFDHFTETMHILGFNYNEHKIDVNEAVEKLVKRINDMDFSYIETQSESFEYKLLTDIEQSKKEYQEKIIALKKHIVDGDIIQAVPSRRIQIECKATAMQAYGKLRRVNPSPYMFYLNFDQFQLVGASPESLVRVQGDKAVIHPIAGTIRRGKDDAEDEILSNELRNNPKEQAEHLMLVDLARNDLGRICKTGSVVVSEYMECEKFSHVIHLVSTTEGVVRSGVKSIQVLRAAFPAGTVSGAPKINAMQILSKLEKVKRNFYAGAVGYIQNSGDLDFCITIRSALRKNDIWTIQAGGGIVNDSVPEREFEETQEKLGALLDTLTK
ncbi:MAG: anthranilate synthase component I [Treponema sp.]|jgi:anthranilate synthase component 1|nr:anthranilate synthase component I [Treponema sp.]